MKDKILVVDDDSHIRQVIVFALEKIGKNVYQAKNGKEAISIFNEIEPDMIILDINMPEIDGFEVCKEIRKNSDIPILFLSSRDDEIDRIVGLEIGGDDYVTKPFSPRELTARVNAILKRVNSYDIRNNQNDTNIISHGSLLMEIDNHICRWEGVEISLTATEFSILQGLLKYPKKVFNRDDIMNNSYDININVSDRTIDSHIRRIRSKFEGHNCNKIIETVRGVGYRLGSF